MSAYDLKAPLKSWTWEGFKAARLRLQHLAVVEEAGMELSPGESEELSNLRAVVLAIMALNKSPSGFKFAVPAQDVSAWGLAKAEEAADRLRHLRWRRDDRKLTLTDDETAELGLLEAQLAAWAARVALLTPTPATDSTRRPPKPSGETAAEFSARKNVGAKITTKLEHKAAPDRAKELRGRLKLGAAAYSSPRSPQKLADIAEVKALGKLIDAYEREQAETRAIKTRPSKSRPSPESGITDPADRARIKSEFLLETRRAVASGENAKAPVFLLPLSRAAQNSDCPKCDGVLARQRDPDAGALLNTDACLKCAQRVIYNIDEACLEASLREDGTLTEPVASSRGPKPAPGSNADPEMTTTRGAIWRLWQSETSGLDETSVCPDEHSCLEALTTDSAGARMSPLMSWIGASDLMTTMGRLLVTLTESDYRRCRACKKLRNTLVSGDDAEAVCLDCHRRSQP